VVQFLADNKNKQMRYGISFGVGLNGFIIIVPWSSQHSGGSSKLEDG